MEANLSASNLPGSAYGSTCVKRWSSGSRSSGTKNVKVPQVFIGCAVMANLHAHAWARKRVSCSTDNVEHKSWFFPRLLGDFSYGRGFLPHLGDEHERPTGYWVEVKTRTFTFSARLLREPQDLSPLPHVDNYLFWTFPK